VYLYIAKLLFSPFRFFVVFKGQGASFSLDTLHDTD